jgi:hypothetical protein
MARTVMGQHPALTLAQKGTGSELLPPSASHSPLDTFPLRFSRTFKDIPLKDAIYFR